MRAQRGGVTALELGQHAHPDGGDARGDRDPLRLDEVGQRRGLHARAGHHEVGADGHGRVGEAPGVGVEHRDDRQQPVALAGAQAGDQHAHRVQERRPVGVDDALGVAGGAARVTHRRGLVLVVDPELDGVGAGEELLVVVDLLARRRLGQVAGHAVVHDHDVANRRELVEQRPRQPGERLVDEDDLVLGVVGHVDELLGEEPDVEGVQDPVGAGGGEVQLEVVGRVPPEGADAAVGADAELVEHAAQAPGARRPLAVGAPLLPGGGDRHDTLVEEQLLRPGVEVRQRQREVLHQALHRSVSPHGWWPATGA